MAEVPLPPVEEGLLNAAGVRALLDDVEACTTLLEVRLKGARQERAGTADLAAARQALLLGQARGVQLRYRHDGGTWCDTLLATPAGWRVIRICQDPEER